jgi:hypothetical protein
MILNYICTWDYSYVFIVQLSIKSTLYHPQHHKGSKRHGSNIPRILDFATTLWWVLMEMRLIQPYLEYPCKNSPFAERTNCETLWIIQPSLWDEWLSMCIRVPGLHTWENSSSFTPADINTYRCTVPTKTCRFYHCRREPYILHSSSTPFKE